MPPTKPDTVGGFFTPGITLSLPVGYSAGASWVPTGVSVLAGTVQANLFDRRAMLIPNTVQLFFPNCFPAIGTNINGFFHRDLLAGIRTGLWFNAPGEAPVTKKRGRRVMPTRL